MIEFACRKCGRSMRVPESAAGKQGTCKSCGDSITVPSLETEEIIPIEAISDFEKPKRSPDVPEEQASFVASTGNARPSHVTAGPVNVAAPSQLEYKECPFCSEQVLATAKKCKHCGEMLDVALRSTVEAKRFGGFVELRPLVIIGILLMVFGALGVIVYLNMDTSVAVPSTGSRVHNIGLMQKQQNGLIISLVACGLGLALVVIGRSPASATKIPPLPELDQVTGIPQPRLVTQFTTGEQLALTWSRVSDAVRSCFVEFRIPKHWIDDGFAWLYLGVIIAGGCIFTGYNLVVNKSVGFLFPMICYGIAYGAIASFEERQAKKKKVGITLPNLGWCLLMPIYLWKRLTVLRQSRHHFWIWLAGVFVVPIFMSFVIGIVQAL